LRPLQINKTVENEEKNIFMNLYFTQYFHDEKTKEYDMGEIYNSKGKMRKCSRG